MSGPRRRGRLARPFGRGFRCAKTKCWRGNNDESGFTLIELVIVTAVLPIIIGGLAIGLVSIFSLQTSVSNRISDTEDSQVVSSTYLSDVQGAGFITTQSTSTPQCGTGDQLLGLGSNFSTVTNTFESSISYVSVPTGATTYSLVRNVCTSGSTTPSSTTTISNNLPSAQSAPVVTCNSTANANNQCNAGSAWITTQVVTNVAFAVTETRSNPPSTFSYTLTAVPEASATIVAGGQPINSGTTAGCGFAATGSGQYAPYLCLVDFAALTGNNLLAAEQGCLEMQVTLPDNDEMYFCLGITGAPVIPHVLPTFGAAFLGNSNDGSAFYTDIPGDPALYQNCEGNDAACGADNYNGTGRTVITFSGITVVNSSNVPATGWEVVSADAESTDVGESITWTSNTDLYVLPNDESGVTNPVGNACEGNTETPGGGLTGSGTTQVVCSGGTGNPSNGNPPGTGETSATKTGAAMVWALTPETLTATMVGTGLEAISFGLIL
jgi:prepilin-type N-terminal cleavage/methylation domain-containing protein